MFLIGAIKPIAEKIFKNNFILTRLLRGRQSGEYEIKPVLFLYAVGLVAATKTIFKRKEKTEFVTSLYTKIYKVTKITKW